VLISIIIPAYNEEKLIGETLNAVKQAAAAFRRLEWQTEVIVCDNNSNDRTGEIARERGAKVVFEPINQIARARNCGAAAASGDWLVFVDADSKPSLALFQEVARQIHSGSCVAGGTTVKLDEEALAGRVVTGFWNFLSRSLRLLAGSFIFCDAAVFREVGGFSRELFAGEELNLTQKLKRAARAHGKDIVILHDHPVLTSSRKMHLYSRSEYFWFFLRAVVRYRTVLRSRERCQIWYDGRR
jgi:glycosyltransferase involved in cell wall biosynthesis